jgi:SAM-dependent methyltransferase
MNRWDLYYWLGKTPWDTNITPPEIVNLIEGGDDVPRILPGRAIDLGCGTGTNVLYLAQRGFEAVGVDVSAQAIERARRKAQVQNVNATFYVADLLDPENFPVSGPFDFVMDIGVMHIFDDAGRARYAATLNRLLRVGGYHYTFGFKRGLARKRHWLSYLFGSPPMGITADEVRHTLEPLGFQLLIARDAGLTPEGISRTGWYVSQKVK